MIATPKGILTHLMILVDGDRTIHLRLEGEIRTLCGNYPVTQIGTMPLLRFALFGNPELRCQHCWRQLDLK